MIHPIEPPANDSPSAAPLHLEQSGRYHYDAAGVIAGGVNSNVRLGTHPFCFARAHGSKLIDLDGNEYIDYALGMGPAILGHAPKAVIDAVSESLSLGQLFAGQHQMELTLGRLLQQHIPSAERVRIGMTGSEMNQAALRVARAYTGRPGFVKFEGHYHGWFDNVLVNHSGPANNPSGTLPFPLHAQTAGQSAATMSETYVLPWNDLDAVSRFLASHAFNVAAIITEPVMCNTGAIAPRPDFLQGLRRLCDQHGIVLIVDEVITGFRLGLGGAQARFGVQPDLSVFAKAFGGGFPIAALAGRAEIMDLFATGKVNHSGTYNSNLVSIAAGIATIETLAANDGAIYAAIEQTGERLMDGIRDIARRSGVNLRVSGYGSVFNTHFGDEEVIDYASYKRTDAARQKVLLDTLLLHRIRPTGRGTWFVSAAHSTEDIERTLQAVRKALQSMA